MYKSLKDTKKGFTIIEVLIVLAIAGLIILVVLLAIPSLQRNSRNTGRKNDVSRVGGAVTEWMSNNNGKIPVAANRTSIVNAAGTLGQYDFTPPNETDLLFATGRQGALDNTKQVRIVTNAQCGTDGATIDGGSARQIVLQYTVETGGTAAPRGTPVCQES